MTLKAAFIFFSLPLLAANSIDPRRQVAWKQNKLLNIEFRQDKLLKDLISLNGRIKKQTIKLGQIQKEVEVINAEIDAQKQQIKDASRYLVESKKRLTTKIKAISKIKSGNLLQIALVHSSLTDIEKSAKMMAIVASYDVQFINDYYDKKQKLNLDLKLLNSRFTDLKFKESSLETQKIALEKESQSRRTWLEEVKRSRIFTESEISKIKTNRKGEQSFDDLGIFDVFSKDSIIKNKGSLQSPIEGSIIHSYGVKSTEDSVIVNHSGIFVSAQTNQNIKAVFNAEVIFSGNLEGLGKVLILDHGDNYYSLYGNLSHINVSNRQIVRTGQTIAQPDYNKLFNDSGLYFELRHYSQALNPSHWIRSFHDAN